MLYTFYVCVITITLSKLWSWSITFYRKAVFMAERIWTWSKALLVTMVSTTQCWKHGNRPNWFLVVDTFIWSTHDYSSSKKYFGRQHLEDSSVTYEQTVAYVVLLYLWYNREMMGAVHIWKRITREDKSIHLESEGLRLSYWVLKM